ECLRTMASSPVYPNRRVCYCILHGLVSGRKKSHARSRSHLSLAVVRLSFLDSVLKIIVLRVRRAIIAWPCSREYCSTAEKPRMPPIMLSIGPEISARIAGRDDGVVEEIGTG